MRIKITGRGSLSAVQANSPSAVLSALEQGRPGLSFFGTEKVAAYQLPTTYHSLLDEIRSQYPRLRQHDKTCLLAIAAARAAVAEAHWASQSFDILCGCSRGPTQKWEASYQDFANHATVAVKTSPLTTLGTVGFALADYFGQDGLATSQSVTCSSGLHAILHGVALLRAGMSTRVLAGGAEAPISDFTFAQLRAMRIMADEPNKHGFYSCPIGRHPQGMTLGEGAAMFCLSSAETSNNQSVFEILGIGFAQERNPSISGISESGLAIGKAMEQAMQAAGRQPDLIIPHAPGTVLGDQAELNAIHRLFPQSPPPLYSGKWATGHTFGASGPLAVQLALDLISVGKVPPMPYEIAKGFQQWQEGMPLRSVLINATGFGGNAVSLVVGLPH